MSPILVLISDLGIKNQSFNVKQVIANGTYLKERLFKDVHVEQPAYRLMMGKQGTQCFSVVF